MLYGVYVYMLTHINITGKFELSLTFAHLMFRMGHRSDQQTSVLFKRGLGVNERIELTPCNIQESTLKAHGTYIVIHQ